MAISQEVLDMFILDISLKIIDSRLQPDLPGANELTQYEETCLRQVINDGYDTCTGASQNDESSNQHPSSTSILTPDQQHFINT